MGYMTVELTETFAGEIRECAECGARFHKAGIDPRWIEPDGSLLCLECRYFLLKQAYRRRRRKIRKLRRSFAEIKLALLNKAPNRWEIILGICEACRGEFDVRFR